MRTFPIHKQITNESEFASDELLYLLYIYSVQYIYVKD